MKILIVSGAFYPINTPRAFRATELVKRFVRLGHDVSVYIPRTNNDLASFLIDYPTTVNYYTRKGPIKGTSIIHRVIGRLLNQYAEYPDITIVKELTQKLKEEKGYDLLITVAMPHPIHWAVGKLFEKGNRIAKTWIADCGDPYMLCGTNQFKRPFYFKKMETRWCKYCDYITVPTLDAVNGYYPEFREKIKVIPQAFDFSEVKRQEYKKNPVPTFAFSGNIIPNVRDPKPLLDFLVSLDIDFKFVLYCSKHHLIMPYKNMMPDKFEVYDYIPRLDLLYKLSSMDFLVNIENSTKVQTPSKLIDYGLIGRPILSVNPKSLDKNAVKEFLDGNYSKQFIIPNLNDYDIVNVANQFLSLTK